MTKPMLLFIILCGLALELSFIFNGVPAFDRRYGLDFEGESEKYAESSLRRLLSDCVSGDVGVVFTPTSRSGYGPENIGQLCSHLTRQYGAFQALGDVRRFGKIYDTEGMLTFPYLAVARYENGAALLQVDVYKREQKWHIANLRDNDSDRRSYAILEGGVTSRAFALIVTFLKNCNADNTATQRGGSKHGNVVDFCLSLSQRFGTFDSLGDLKLFGMPTIFDTVYVYLAPVRYDHGTPLLKIEIINRKSDWYIYDIDYF